MKLSKTGEGELLISKNDNNGGYINIIIDNEGCIELLHIKAIRKNSWNKVGVSIDEVIKFWQEN